MVKTLRIDKDNSVIALEVTENELRNIISSIENMVYKQKRDLLGNLPSDEEGRRKLDAYLALKEDLRKIAEM
jgi:cell fate (sporulation/competence/biofilm development) regulator YlbF (YheA/YmcA/DUF963 family)